VLTKYCSGDQMKKNEIGGACSTCGGQLLTRFWWRDLGERDRSENLGVDNIKMHLQETGEDSILH
jgi:hypothetical protein